MNRRLHQGRFAVRRICLERLLLTHPSNSPELPETTVLSAAGWWSLNFSDAPDVRKS